MNRRVRLGLCVLEASPNPALVPLASAMAPSLPGVTAHLPRLRMRQAGLDARASGPFGTVSTTVGEMLPAAGLPLRP